MASSNSSKSPMLPISDPPPRHDDKAFRGSAMSKRGAYAAISYMSCAVLLVIFNKAALSSYNFPSASVITLFQGFEGVPLNFYTSKFEGEASIPAFLNLIPVIRLVWKIFQKWHFISFNGIMEQVNRRIFENLEMYLGKIICSCSFLYALRHWKIISFTVGESSNVNDSSPALVPITTMIHTLPLAVTYLLYMLVTMESVRGVNVPMYTTLRRTTVVFTMFVEYILAGQRYTSSVVGSVGLIVLGAFIAGARDLSFDSYGYAIVFLSNITTAIYLATIARIGKSSGLNSFGLMWCNGILCGPILLFWTFIRGDLGMALNFPHFSSPGFLVVLLLSCILAFFLNYSIFLNTTLNSAVTQTICGNLKDLFTIGLGWMIFGGLPFDILNITGQFLGFLGSGLYAYYKLIGK